MWRTEFSLLLIGFARTQNWHSLRRILYLVRAGVLIALIGWPLSVAAAGEDTVWTLQTAAKRILEVAPEWRAAQAEVAAREAALKRDTAWPNPTVAGQVDQKLGMESGTGGINATQLSLTQAVPLTRLSRQRTQATASLAAARAAQDYERLVLEHEAALAFHRLQLAAANRKLAHDRYSAAQQYSAPHRKGDRLVRYLSMLDRTRLSILAESARQAMITADGEWNEAASHFGALLALPAEAQPVTAPLAEIPPPPSLSDLASKLEANPALAAARHNVDAARAGIGVARSSRFADPTVTIFRERDVLGGAQRDYNGIMIGVQVPLWNSNRGPVDQASAEADRVDNESRAQQRNFTSALQESYQRLTRLIGQANHFSATVLEPSRKFLTLARRSFNAGESGVLALLDANNNYFDAVRQHLELLSAAAVADADLRLAAGVSLTQEAQP